MQMADSENAGMEVGGYEGENEDFMSRLQVLRLEYL